MEESSPVDLRDEGRRGLRTLLHRGINRAQPLPHADAGERERAIALACGAGAAGQSREGSGRGRRRERRRSGDP